MRRDAFRELQEMNPYPEELGRAWAATETNRPSASALEGSSYVEPEELTPSRRRTTKVASIAAGLLLAGAVGVAVVGLLDREDPDSVPLDSSAEGVLGEICAEPTPVEVDDAKVDWAAVEATFDVDGAFRLPPKPKWVSAHLYCRSVLSAAQPAPPSPDGSRNAVNGPNRFVVFVGPDGGADDAVAMNQVLLQMYPTSVHAAYGLDGKQRGHFAPGVEFVEGDVSAESVASDPRVVAAVESMVAGCSPSRCDDYMEAALDAGPAAALGEPVPTEE